MFENSKNYVLIDVNNLIKKILSILSIILKGSDNVHVDSTIFLLFYY